MAKTPEAPKRQHKATYSKDKFRGGYLVRVEGPHAPNFVGKEVPVTQKSGAEEMEKLTHLITSGVDKESGIPYALYRFLAKPRDVSETEF